MVIKGKTITMDDLEQIRIFNSEDEIEALNEVWGHMEITQEFITEPPGSDIEPAPHPGQELAPPTDTREVFVVHGRNLAARDALFDFLRAIDLRPLEWSEAVQSTGRASPYIGDILNAAFSKAHAVVVLMTPDDEAQLREPLRGDNDPTHETELTGQARPNVLFEAGMAMGRNENRTILVELDTLRPFSDIGGRHVIRLDNSTQRRQDLAKRLQAAGCPVNLDGTDWHTAGNFEAALELTVRMSSESSVAMEEQSINTKPSQLSERAKSLLLDEAEGSGTILNVSHRDENPRTRAEREQTIDELAEQGFVKDRSGEGKIFNVTDKGFKYADILKGK